MNWLSVQMFVWCPFNVRHVLYSSGTVRPVAHVQKSYILENNSVYASKSCLTRQFLEKCLEIVPQNHVTKLPPPRNHINRAPLKYKFSNIRQMFENVVCCLLEYNYGCSMQNDLMWKLLWFGKKTSKIPSKNLVSENGT